MPHIHVAAYHAEAGYNNDTPGAGVLCVLSQDYSLLAGQYRNSVGRDSTYIATAYQPWSLGPARLGVFGGYVTGYQDASAIPFAGGVATLAVTSRVSLHLVAIPAVTNQSAAVVQASFSYRF